MNIGEDRREGTGSEQQGPREAEPMASDKVFRPAPPVAKRLNRNALTVVAALAGVTVITVLVVTRPGRTAAPGVAQQAQSQSPPVPARPSFLDEPPKPSSAPRADTARGDAQTGLPVPPPIAGGSTSLQPPGVTFHSTGDVQGASPSPRHQAYEAALTSSVIVGASGTQQRGAAEASLPGDVMTGVPNTLEVSSRSPTDVPRAAPNPLNSEVPSAMVPPPNGASAAPSPGSTIHLDSAGSPFTIRAGTVIPGLLVSGVNSDLPGEVLGQTSRDVYDSRTQQILLVPQGSRLIGSYDNRSVGSGRLIVAWTRLILPDGRSLALPRLAGTDAQGQVGLHDEVDHHYGRVYGAALLTSALTAGVQLSQPQQSALYAAPSSRQVAAGALGQTMGDVALESARRGLDIPPTIVIRPGQPFNVFLNGDLTFPGEYQPVLASATPP